MTQLKIGYPFSYGDELTPEIAHKNRKAIYVYSVFIYSTWSYIFGFGKQTQSSFQNQNISKTEIVRLVQSRDTVSSISRGGDLGKSGPGPRTKADAIRHTPTRKNGSGSIFVNGFVPQNQYCQYHKYQSSSCKTPAKLIPVRNLRLNPLFDQQRPDRSKSKLTDRNVTVESEYLKFKTPDDLSDKIQEISDAKQIGKVKHVIQFRKKQIYKKYKHRYLFKNPNGSSITSKKEFFESQIDHVQSPDVYFTTGILLSKNHDPVDCDLYIKDDTRVVIQVKPDGDYISSREMSPAQYARFKRHGVISQDQERFDDVSFITHDMKAKDVMNHYNFHNKGKFSDEVIDSIECAQTFADIMENPSPRDDL